MLHNFRQLRFAQNPSLKYKEALKLRQPGTGLWFLEIEHYNNWKTDPASFLRIEGIPGCGKTVLASTIVEDMIRSCEKDPRTAVSYFYFDLCDQNEEVPQLLVRSIISQLSEQCKKVPSSLEAAFSLQESGRYRTPSFLQLLRQIIIEEFSQAYIILDGLDECASRDELIDILNCIVSWQCENLHILITSRDNTGIESSLECLPEKQRTIRLEGAFVDEDIQIYIRQRLSTDKNLCKWQNFRQEIEEKLIERGHGMYESFQPLDFKFWC
jgi:hypothetical protein